MHILSNTLHILHIIISLYAILYYTTLILYRSEYDRTRDGFEESSFAIAYRKLCLYIDTHNIMNDEL